MTDRDKLWRQLVRVVDVSDNREYCHIVVPGWYSNEKIKINLETLPENIQGLIMVGKRLHAQVNVGAENYEDLRFCQWEID